MNACSIVRAMIGFARKAQGIAELILGLRRYLSLNIFQSKKVYRCIIEETEIIVTERKGIKYRRIK